MKPQNPDQPATAEALATRRQELLRELQGLKEITRDNMADGTTGQLDVWAFVTMHSLLHPIGDPVAEHYQRKERIIQELEQLGMNRDEIHRITAVRDRRYR